MSEYQYYEFRAIDRPLAGPEIAELRALSSRARIDSTSFINVYTYGDFRGDPNALMERYFDAFVYVADWGTHRFMLRVPANAIANSELASYCSGDSFAARHKGGHRILSFCVEEVDIDCDEDEGWMGTLLPIREELLRGDFRALYLGWLGAVQNEEVDSDQMEPPLPPGLRTLTAPLRRLSEFLDLDSDLLEVAAEPSTGTEAERPTGELQLWIASLPQREKDAVLFQAASGQDPRAIPDLLRRFRTESAKAVAVPSESRRTAGELLIEVDRRREDRERREAKRRQLEQDRVRRAEALARTKYLDNLEQRGDDLWVELDRLVATKRPKDYARAVTLLTDLREVAERKSRSTAFQERYRELRARHVSKPAFLRRLTLSGLDG